MPGLKDSQRNYFDLSGKVAVVTGGTGILVTLFCQRLAESGARVVRLYDKRYELYRELYEGIPVVK